MEDLMGKKVCVWGEGIRVHTIVDQDDEINSYLLSGYGGWHFRNDFVLIPEKYYDSIYTRQTEWMNPDDWDKMMDEKGLQ